jgi:endonuclease-3
MTLRASLPQKYWGDYNSMLVLWGQNVCKPISPLCSQCGLKKFCARVNVGISR